MARGSSFNDYLLEDLSDFYCAKQYLVESVNNNDEEFLIDAIRTIVKAQGPTQISKIAGGNKQGWAELKNPRFSTISSFLKAFGLKVGVYDIGETA